MSYEICPVHYYPLYPPKHTPIFTNCSKTIICIYLIHVHGCWCIYVKALTYEILFIQNEITFLQQINDRTLYDTHMWRLKVLKHLKRKSKALFYFLRMWQRLFVVLTIHIRTYAQRIVDRLWCLRAYTFLLYLYWVYRLKEWNGGRNR